MNYLLNQQQTQGTLCQCSQMTIRGNADEPLFTSVLSHWEMASNHIFFLYGQPVFSKIKIKKRFAVPITHTFCLLGPMIH